MPTQKTLISILSVIALGFTMSATAVAEGHSHDGHHAATIALSLNADKKWQGDDSMRKGMSEIRTVIASHLHEIHEDHLGGKGYKVLAISIQKQVDYMLENCRLSVEVDEQLHMVLAQVIEGIAEMENNSYPRKGAVKIIKALNAYGKHFEHSGWQPVGK